MGASRSKRIELEHSVAWQWGLGSAGCLENNTSATSEWETWEVQLWSQLVVAHPIIILWTVRQR